MGGGAALGLSGALDEAFARARSAGDLAALARLFAAAAERQHGAGAEAFMLTQAYAIGLGEGLSEVDAWRARLVALGAEADERPDG